MGRATSAKPQKAQAAKTAADHSANLGRYLHPKADPKPSRPAIRKQPSASDRLRSKSNRNPATGGVRG